VKWAERHYLNDGTLSQPLPKRLFSKIEKLHSVLGKNTAELKHFKPYRRIRNEIAHAHDIVDSGIYDVDSAEGSFDFCFEIAKDIYPYTLAITGGAPSSAPSGLRHSD
jgi:hypothetical protein